jgi:tRNA (cytidine/uridine-2'-O-)-methyltransferase
MRLALYEPDIPQNTGTILRTAACLGVPVDLIAPAGFDMTDRALRRAGLDYLKHVDLTRHESFAAFDAARRADGRRLILLTTHADTTYTAFAFTPADTLLLGRESAGVPPPVHAAADARLRIPMITGLRSLNVAVAAAMVLGEALRRTDAFPVWCKTQDDLLDRNAVTIWCVTCAQARAAAGGEQVSLVCDTGRCEEPGTPHCRSVPGSIAA